MIADSLSLVEVLRKPRGNRYAFDRSVEFPASWWYAGYPESSTSHCVSAWRGGVEVARCKFVLSEVAIYGNAYGPMPDGQLDILALEVALSARKGGVGRAFLLALREMYPTPAFTTLNDNDESRRFWDAVGWRRHESSSPLASRSERANYSEV